MKSIYTLYKERLIEISGKNRNLYMKTFNKKNGYDIGKILRTNIPLTQSLIDDIWNGKSVSFKLISKETKENIFQSSDINRKFPASTTFEDPQEQIKYDRQRSQYGRKIIAQEVRNIKALNREIEDIEKETGRYELFMCYPFVYGAIKDYTFKAPLLMFPINIETIDDYNVNIRLRPGDHVFINKALLLAIADSNHLNLEDIETEFDTFKNKFADVKAVIEYLRKFGIKINYKQDNRIYPFNHYDDPIVGDSLEVKHLCLLARCSLANSIYNDYSTLEKRHLTNNSINELLNTKPTKSKKSTDKNLYLINNIDYAQQTVVKNVNDYGNMVIYGPPGTGKSQTIVNIVSDAICRGKKVLIISQKKAALEVIYNRLTSLQSKAMFIVDSEKEKKDFYTQCQVAHEKAMHGEINTKLFQAFEDENNKLKYEINNLKTISNCLNTPCEFGLTLQEMYNSSYKIGKQSVEYDIYKNMLKNNKLMSLNYNELSGALSLLNEKNTAEIYFSFMNNSKINPFIHYLRDDLSVHTVAESQTKLRSLCKSNISPFNQAKYKYSRQIIPYLDKLNNKASKNSTIRTLFKLNRCKKLKEFTDQINISIEAINEYLQSYEFLHKILKDDGYNMAIDNIICGNNDIPKLLKEAMDNYIKLRDMNNVINNMDENQVTVLDFAYKYSDSYEKYMTTLSKILPIRIYHEIVNMEGKEKLTLSSMVDFENIRDRIVSHKSKLNDISRAIAEQSFTEEYKKMINGSVNCKDYIYQITKQQNYWPIRKMMDVFGNYLFKLFPCWLLSPENVSTLLPLYKDMFDIVLFDEASQIFIENSIPSIYRGKTIVVAGDTKQLRPTATFMRRYMGANTDEDLDYSTQAAMEVESLLDLAISRFNSARITYHYRSQNEELINFSNRAFYDNSLRIAPNISRNIHNRPIQRILVNGKWDNGKNHAEAEKVVELIKTILKTRKKRETLGIITFNAEQEAYIHDLIDEKCLKDEEFRKLYTAEQNRIDNGQDVSIFIKNIENVQGDERDIIIFSIGYARNEYGKVNYIFGSLSFDGGENRLNVAITRAKQKVYVVTSIEPEELKVDASKFNGPKLLRSYLSYARAVSNRNREETKTILESLHSLELNKKIFTDIQPVEMQIANSLKKLGYSSDINLGNSSAQISVAIYDRKKDKYVLGIETDQSATFSSTSVLERDVFRNEFLKSNGWKTMRVWARDWWHNSTQVINSIVKEIERLTTKNINVASKLNKASSAKSPKTSTEKNKKN